MSNNSEKIIGVRELVRNTKAVSRETRKGVSFIVMRNTEPLFRIEPVVEGRGKKYSKKDLMGIRFKSGERDLSKKIDNIVYGA